MAKTAQVFVSFIFFLKVCTLVELANVETSKKSSGEIYGAAEGVYSVRLGKIEYTVYHKEPLTWEEAYEFCKNNQSSLTVLDTREKLVNLQLFLMKQNFVQAQMHDVDPGYIYWIGGNNVEDYSEWKWVPTNTLFSYTHWLAGKPTDADDERCVEMGDKSLGRWSNSPCSFKRFYICERSLTKKWRKNEL